MKIALLAAVAGLGLVASSADAAVNIYVSNTDTGVLAQSLGTLDLTGLTFFRQATSGSAIKGDAGFLGTGANGVTQDGYMGFTGPEAFGDTLRTGASSGTGDAFAFNLGNYALFVPEHYKSGTAIVSSAFYQYLTLQSLELYVGTYTYVLPHDTITLHIGEAAPAAPLPEPASWALMLVGFGAIGSAMRSRKVAVRFG